MILELERQYFTKIYSEDPDNLEEIDDLPIRWSNSDLIPKISDVSKRASDQPFTQEEFLQTLKDLNKNKSPSSDGLTPEFYLTFWPEFKDPFFDSFLYSLERGTLTEEQRTGDITLIPKKNQLKVFNF